VYADIYQAWKNEKTSESPQPLPQDFYRRAESYLRGLQSNSSDTRTLQSQLNQKEKEVVSRLLQELKETRIRKLVTAARDGKEVNAAYLTDDEKTLIKNLTASLQSPTATLTKSEEPPEPERTIMSVVRFLQDIPEIVGTDLKIYGPYKKEDVGSLPSQNAEALMKQGAVKMVEVKNIPQVTS
jgi:DNA replication factor GINS